MTMLETLLKKAGDDSHARVLYRRVLGSEGWTVILTRGGESIVGAGPTLTSACLRAKGQLDR